MPMVPSNRLLFWTAAVCLPFGVLAALLPAAGLPACGSMLLLLVLAIADAGFSRKRLAEIQVEFPERLRLSKDQTAEVSIRIRQEKKAPTHLRMGLCLPPEIRLEPAIRLIRLPADVRSSLLQWSCIGLKLGTYLGGRCCLETASYLGFWAMRAARPIQTEIHVYPNLLLEKRHLTALFSRRRLGSLRRRQIGKGREFEQLRDYLPGDSFEDIHWKATAKRRRPISKVFQIERTQEIYVIIDASRLSGRNPRQFTLGAFQERRQPSFSEPGPFHPTILERFITAALILGLAAERQGDHFGLITFSHQVKRFIKAGSGKAHFNACREALFQLTPEAVNPDFDELFTFIGSRLRRRALLLFLTNLDETALAEAFLRHLDLLCRRHLLLVNTLKPAGAEPFFSRPDVRTRDDLYKRLAGHLQWAAMSETEKMLRRLGAGFAVMDSAGLCPALVEQYLTIKQRQAL